MEQFISDLTSSKFYKKLFEFDEVIMIYIAGSRILGCIDDRSDYDLIVITRNKSNYKLNEYLVYENKKVHWYFQSIDTFYADLPLTVSNCVGLSAFKEMRDELIIYKNPKYNELINTMMNHKIAISAIGSLCGYKTQMSLINQIITDGTVRERNKTKIIYMLCAMYYNLVDEPLDIEFLSIIKRIRWRDVPEKYIDQCVDVLINFKKYVESIDIDQKITERRSMLEKEISKFL